MDSTEDRYSHIADLSEQIDKLNQLIHLHQRTTNDASTIRQYVFRREEFLNQLRQEFQAINLVVSLNDAA